MQCGSVQIMRERLKSIDGNLSLFTQVAEFMYLITVKKEIDSMHAHYPRVHRAIKKQMNNEKDVKL